ncbi:MAG: two-component regulator propeller domain-containing protein [Marinoscillum sp.]
MMRFLLRFDQNSQAETTRLKLCVQGFSVGTEELKGVTRKLLFFIIFTFLLHHIYALDNGARFRKIGMNEGLSFNSVLCFIQDQEGFVWIGTRDGLNKYDGVENTIYRHQFHDSLSLSNNHINSLFQDSRGKIWIATANGLNVLDKENNSFKRFYSNNGAMSISHRYTKCIAEAPNGDIWVGASEGLNIFRNNADTVERLLVKNMVSNANNIIDMYFDLTGNLWLCTRGGLFFSQDYQSISRVFLDEPLEAGLDFFEFRDLIQDKNGLFWAATENYGLFSFSFSNGNPSNVKNYNQSNSGILSNQIRKLEMINEVLWMASLDGVDTFNPGKGTFTEITGEGLSQSSFHDILVDSDEGIWLASYTDGVNYYHLQNNLFPHVYQSLLPHEGLNDNSVTGFLDDGEKGLWVSTGGGGLNYFDKGAGEFIYFTEKNSSISNNNIKSMSFDQKGDLWIGTYNGLNYYSRKQRTFQTFFHKQNDPNSIIQNQIHAVHVDQFGDVWIGTNGGGIQVYHPEKDSFEVVSNNFLNINNIFQDQNNRLWIGSNGGVECVDLLTRELIDIQFKSETPDEKLFFVNNITSDIYGRILIGTQNHGLCIIDGSKINWLNQKNGFVSNTINAVIESSANTYWISTNNGLVNVGIKKNADSISFEHTEFDISHGLQSMQYYPSSVMKDQKGKLYFGGVNGYNAFYPKNITKRNYYPPIFISELTVFADNQNIKAFSYPLRKLTRDSSITLTYDERNILLKYGGINFVNPEQLYYRYSLGNNSQFWNDLKQQRTLNLTYLPIGKHELKLQATSNPDHWGESYQKINLTILPPFWRTWWAYLIYVIILAVLLYLYFYFSLQWADLKSSLLMGQFQKEKEKELHESKLRFFTDVSHELRTPLTLILAPIENILQQSDIKGRFRNQLQMIQRNGTRMFHLINQILDLRKLETGNERLQVAKGDIVKFVREICLAFDSVSGINQIDLKVTVDEESHLLWFDRDKMEVVFYNLLSNAFKYTPKHGNISLNIKKVTKAQLPSELSKKGSHGGIQISISDSGQGIPKEDLTNIFKRYYSKKDLVNKNPTGIGLELAKRMVDIHHGYISVNSEVETQETKGSTSFIIFLPNGKKHFETDEIINDFRSSEDVSQYTYDFIQREKQFELDAAVQIEAKETIQSKKKKTLLVVEDNAEVRSFITNLLQSEYNVIEAINGKNGLEQTLKYGPDLIICDIMMPEMNGIEMCREVKKDHRCSHTPVILLTARTAITFKFEGFETGADEYITKPFSASYLLLRIKNLLSQREILQNHFNTEKILEPKDLSITSVDEKLLKKAIDYINANISNTNITVNELSHELGLSRVHFYRKMKALTNMTAIEFIRSIRLRNACQLLEQGKFNIKEVKNYVGFENAEYFRKCFKEAYHMTPSEYAARHSRM